MNKRIEDKFKKKVIDVVHMEMVRYRKYSDIEQLSGQVTMELDRLEYEESVNVYHGFVKASCRIAKSFSDNNEEIENTYGLITVMCSVGGQFDTEMEILNSEENRTLMIKLMIEAAEPKIFEIFNICFLQMELPETDFFEFKRG